MRVSRSTARVGPGSPTTSVEPPPRLGLRTRPRLRPRPPSRQRWRRLRGARGGRRRRGVGVRLSTRMHRRRVGGGARVVRRIAIVGLVWSSGASLREGGEREAASVEEEWPRSPVSFAPRPRTRRQKLPAREGSVRTKSSDAGVSGRGRGRERRPRGGGGSTSVVVRGGHRQRRAVYGSCVHPRDGVEGGLRTSPAPSAPGNRTPSASALR